MISCSFSIKVKSQRKLLVYFCDKQFANPETHKLRIVYWTLAFLFYKNKNKLSPLFLSAAGEKYQWHFARPETDLKLALSKLRQARE